MPLCPRGRAFTSVLTVALLLFAAGPHPRAQDFIDLEAERERDQANEAATPYPVGVTPTADEPPPLAGPNVGGLFNQVQQLQQEVMRLNGVVEQLTYELNQLKQQSLERYVDIDRRLAGGAAAVPGAPAGTGVATTPAESGALIPSPVTSPTVTVEEQPGEGEAYRAAYALVRGQEFDAAVTAFDSFLRRYPDGRYAPNAHYWLGELYLVLDPPDPEASRQAFMLLLDQYPTNSKVPDALYKLGRVHFIKGNNVRAREFLNRVMSEYPDSTAARLAGDFLDQNL